MCSLFYILSSSDCVFVFFPFICKYVNPRVVGEGCTSQETTAEEGCYSSGCGRPDGRGWVEYSPVDD